MNQFQFEVRAHTRADEDSFFLFFSLGGLTTSVSVGVSGCTEIGPYVVGTLFDQHITSKSSLFFQKIKSGFLTALCANKEEGREEKVDELPYLQLPPHPHPPWKS